MENRQIILAARPEGLPKESDFRLIETETPQPDEGQFLVRTEFLSVDPYMRGRISEIKSYAEPVAIGEVMVGGTVGTVLESKHRRYSPGDVVVGYWGWQEYAISDGKEVQRFDSSWPRCPRAGRPGMPGLTAYFGLLDIGQPKPGETVFISGAAGAVGAIGGTNCQDQRLPRGRIGRVPGQGRALLTDLGLDAAFNYKDVTDYAAQLQAVCPQGIDVYFDNVGGPLTDAVFTHINPPRPHRRLWPD